MLLIAIKSLYNLDLKKIHPPRVKNQFHTCFIETTELCVLLQESIVAGNYT